jgi:hypothetical protein
MMAVSGKLPAGQILDTKVLTCYYHALILAEAADDLDGSAHDPDGSNDLDAPCGDARAAELAEDLLCVSLTLPPHPLILAYGGQSLDVQETVVDDANKALIAMCAGATRTQRRLSATRTAIST